MQKVGATKLHNSWKEKAAARFATKKDYPTRTVRGLVTHTLVMWLSGTYLVLLWIVTIVIGHMLMSAKLLIYKRAAIIVINNKYLRRCLKLLH